MKKGRKRTKQNWGSVGKVEMEGKHWGQDKWHHYSDLIAYQKKEKNWILDEISQFQIKTIFFFPTNSVTVNNAWLSKA